MSTPAWWMLPTARREVFSVRGDFGRCFAQRGKGALRRLIEQPWWFSRLNHPARVELLALVESAIDGSIRKQNAGERNAIESFLAGGQLYEWMKMREDLQR